MTSKKMLVALAFLLSATSVTLAQGGRSYYGAPYGYSNYAAPYGYGPGMGPYSEYGAGRWEAYGEQRPDVAQPSPHQGVESQR